MKKSAHLPLVALMAILVGLAFIQSPGFGDDLTYWMQALDVHEHGTAAWERGSFHDLRWPVWGICWAIQGMLGFGIASFYGEPLFYLALGSIIAFALGRRLLGNAAAGWAGAMAFLYHPLLDSVCFRPMPDLSEGVLGGAAIGMWWLMANATSRAKTALSSLGVGVLVYILIANRVTGAFIIPILVLNTLLFFPRRFLWLVLSGGVAVVCHAGEAAFYHGLFGDWFHYVNANMRNAGNKGTEPIPLWWLPLRFVDALVKGNPLAPFYFGLALIGIAHAWRRLGTFGRVLVVWFVVLYLEYSCTPQPIWPIRPLLRDADRFLAGLAVPMSLLAIAGLWWLWEKLNAWRPLRLPATATGVVAFIALFAITKRDRFDLGFVPEFREYLCSIPAGTKVFTHEPMRAIALMCDAEKVAELNIDAPPVILQSAPELERRASEASEFWYARKLVWLGTRKALERGEFPKQPKLGSYFDEPEQEWRLVRLLAKGDTPDLIFYRRRTAEMPPPQVLSADAPEFSGLLPELPYEWKSESGKRETKVKWDVPVSLRGNLVRLETVAGSPGPEVFTLRLKFKTGEKVLAEYLLKPYLHPAGGKDFFVFTVPPEAERCEFTLKFNSKAQNIRFESLRAVLETPL